MQTQNGEKNMTFKIQKNNLDSFYSSDPKVFAKKYFKYLSKVLQSISVTEIEVFIKSLLEARKTGASIFFAGNGGSAATASHFANDIAIGTNDYNIPFKAISLSDNNTILTALGNDFGYDEVFSRQIQVLGKKGDLIVCISASGNSPNLIKAFSSAKSIGIKTIAITAFDGGKMKKLADEGIHVPTEQKEYGPAEDAHMVLDHLVSGYLMRYIKNG
jgi:D-sedoheptulose 7-phosphate isomerase